MTALASVRGRGRTRVLHLPVGRPFQRVALFAMALQAFLGADVSARLCCNENVGSGRSCGAAGVCAGAGCGVAA